MDVEVLKEWEEDGVVLRIVRYRIGIFKGQKTMMAAIYGFPKGGTNLPGLVQIHGGGQFADHKAVLANAKRGYATVSIAWAGRISAPGYLVDSPIVNLFIEGNTADPAYKVTTDWKGFNGYHAVERKNRPAAAFAEWKLDEFADSPRNSTWFLWAMGSRRALTFLEQQPEVNADKLGVYGHSMGGKLTVLTAAADARVKAAAPSCGGVSARGQNPSSPDSPIDDDVSLRHISCPIIFLSPANDFHGRINDLQKAIQEITSKDWRITCSPHHQHQDTAEYEVAGPLWFDQCLKGAFRFPKIPEAALELKTETGLPVFTIAPDPSRPIVSVDIFYTQQGQKEGEPDSMQNTSNRFWHHAKAKQNGNSWSAELPLFSTDKQLWVYGNVLYSLDSPVKGAGYYYAPYTADSFNISSKMAIVLPEELKASGVRATAKPSLQIESFEPGWQKEWFSYKPEEWSRSTHKVYDPQWAAPALARLAFEVRSAQANKLVVGLDDQAAEVAIKGGGEWQRVVLTPADFLTAKGTPVQDWKEIKTLRFGAKETLKAKVDGADKVLELGGEWKGDAPEFQDLRWIEPTLAERNAMHPAAPESR